MPSMKLHHFLYVGLVLVCADSHAQAVTVDTDCSSYGGGGTVQINECRQKQYEIWDQSLNSEYKAALKRVDPAQKDPLRKAQRLWLQYLKANCETYERTEGSVGSMLGSSCILDMTKQRTLELKALGQLTG